MKKPIYKLIIIAVLFLSNGFLFAQTNSNDYLGIANSCMAQLDNSQNFADNLNHVDMNNLPMGIKKTINNMEVTIAVYQAEIHTQYTSASVYVRIKIPEKDKVLFFGLQDAKFSNEGSLIGDISVTLLGDIDIPVSEDKVTLRLKGNFDNITGQGGDLTFVKLDCEGFKALKLTGEVELAPGTFYKVGSDDNIIANEKVTASFQTEVENWNDFVIQLSFPRFAINGLDGFIWNFEDVVLDFSDTRNAAAVAFPPEYSAQYLIPGNHNLWRGVYAKDISITLPPQFSKNNGNRITIYAHDMFIDDNGVTGIFGVENILSFNEGDANGWSFSVDNLAFKLLANNFEHFEFTGRIGLPIDDKLELQYFGFISADNEYVLQVSNLDTISFDILQAKANILPNSYLKFQVINNKFLPEALLNGNLDLTPKIGNDNISSVKLEFQEMKIQTQAPYFSVKYFGYQGEVKILNLPVSIKDIGLTMQGNNISLGFGVDITLQDSLFKGSTTLAINAEIRQEGGKQKWRYKSTEVSDISLDVNIKDLFYLKGFLSIKHNDPVYGDGFGGGLEIGFKKAPLKDLKVNMTGMFGRTEFRYWYLDGLVQLPGNGLPVFTGVYINGFGGAISYQMKPTTMGTSSQVAGDMGLHYVPDAESSLGLKASVMLVIPKKEVLQGEVSCEIAFNKNGGIKYAGLFGYAKFMGEIPGVSNSLNSLKDKLGKIVEFEEQFTNNNPALKNTLDQMRQNEPNNVANLMNNGNLGQAGIEANVGILLDFENESLHCSFDLYANIAGGLLTGVSSNNRAGWAVLHIDKNDWYLHAGTPTDRLGLKIGIGNFLNIKTGAYFMVGTNIPAAPGVPTQISNLITTGSNLDYMGNLNEIGAGNGIAFGADFSIETGDITFLILYANFGMGLGFDFMLKDYGESQCQGRSGPIGIDGWYANGQAYAYMHGELGVKVNLIFIKKKIPIISADVATLMQAKFPNPSFFRAYLAVSFNLLGGLVKGNCNFEMSFGDDCKIINPGGSPFDMEMIVDVAPTDAESNVDVFAVPQAQFAMGTGKKFDVTNDDGKTETYRIQLKEFSVRQSNNQLVAGELRWNEDKDAVSFYSTEVLPSQQQLKAIVKINFEELKAGSWVLVKTGGVEAVESREITFTTGEAPDYIPLHNIAYCYPVIEQNYLLKDESNSGYVQLDRGQSYLFSEAANNYIIKFVLENDTKLETAFNYNVSEKCVEFTLPQLSNSTKYFLSVESNNVNTAAAGVKTQSLLNDDSGGSIEITTKQAVLATREDKSKTYLGYDFSTSRYSTLSEKVDNIVKYLPNVTKINSLLYSLAYQTTNMEPFDIVDIKGNQFTSNKPLIMATAQLNDAYYNSNFKNLIYNNPLLTSNNILINNRDLNVLGFPPARALPIIIEYETDIENNIFTGLATRYFPLRYDLFRIFYNDFQNIQSQVLNSTLGTSSPLYQQFVLGTFPRIAQGNYDIKLQFVLPGKDIQGTNAIFQYYNFIE